MEKQFTEKESLGLINQLILRTILVMPAFTYTEPRTSS
jgi:hypothetical protein